MCVAIAKINVFFFERMLLIFIDYKRKFKFYLYTLGLKKVKKNVWVLIKLFYFFI